jgi:hypothetical protein
MRLMPVTPDAPDRNAGLPDIAIVSMSDSGRGGTGGVSTAVATAGRGRGVAQTTQLRAESGASFPQVGHLII